MDCAPFVKGQDKSLILKEYFLGESLWTTINFARDGTILASQTGKNDD